MTWLQYMTWIMSAATITSVWMVGNKDVRGWYVGLFSQGLWIVYILTTHTWGFVPTTAFLIVVQWRNARRWKRDQNI